MTTLPRPEPQTNFNRLRSMFSSTVLGGGEVIPESNEWYVVTNDTAVMEMFYSIGDQMWKERDPRFACCENLLAMGANDGIYPTPASPAEGYIQLLGAPNATMPAAIQIQFQDQTFDVVSTIPATFPTSTELTLRVRSQTLGSAGNVTTANGTTGTLVTPITGVSNTVTVFGAGFCGGVEAETCEEFRTRYVDRLQYKPRQTLETIEAKILEWPCVTRVCLREGSCCLAGEDCNSCESCAECGNLLQFYPFMDDTFECGLPPQCVVDEISAWLFGVPQGYGRGQMEYGVCGSLHAATAVTVDVNIVGMNCLTDEQLEEVKIALTDFFSTLCPSQTVCARSLDLAVAQIAGTGCEYEIRLVPQDTSNLTINDCGDLTMDCDFMACLGEVTFLGERQQGGGC